MALNIEDEIELDFDKISQDGIKLVIYYLPLDLLTIVPLSNESLMNGYYNYKIVIGTSVLENYVDILNGMKSIKLERMPGEEPFNARIFCKFADDKGKTFTFSLNGSSKMMINQRVYENNLYFYKLILPFLPSDESIKVQKYISMF